MDSSDLLSVWERGLGQSPIQRGLCLLAAAWPEWSVEAWAQRSIGERDEHLLRLRESLFGKKLEGVAACPECKERVELAFSTSDIRAEAQIAHGETLHIESSGYALICRVPNSLDVLESSAMPPAAQREGLLSRCIVAASRDGSAVSAASLPESVITAMAEQLAGADPQAAVEFAVTCPSCSHQWLTAFDILSYLWGEVEDWAQRLMLDIHALASAYGWSERDILVMTPLRRRMYLDLLGT